MKIALVGKMRSGKNTVADMITGKFGGEQLAFADGITKVIEICFPEELKSGKKPREHYQFIGQELRKLNIGVWIDYLDRQVKEKGLTDIVVTDCRQVLEAEYLRANGYMIIKILADDSIRLHRAEVYGQTVTEEQFRHVTELEVDWIEEDYTIHNVFDLEHLQNEADRALEHYNTKFLLQEDNKNEED